MKNRVVDREMKLKILTIIPIVTEIIALLFLPAQVPVHYNMSFQVTEYGSKYTLLVLGVVIVQMVQRLVFWQTNWMVHRFLRFSFA